MQINMETKLEFYQIFARFTLLKAIKKYEGKTQFPFKIGPYRLSELPFYSPQQSKVKEYITTELKYLNPVLKQRNNEDVVYFEIGSDFGEKFSLSKKTHETMDSYSKYIEDQYLVRLRELYSRLISLLNVFFSGYLALHSEGLVLEYTNLCVAVDRICEIPGISFLEDFKKKYRRPLESLRAIPEEYDEVWNGVSRPKAVNLLGSLDRPWIEAGGPKCEIP